LSSRCSRTLCKPIFQPVDTPGELWNPASSDKGDDGQHKNTEENPQSGDPKKQQD
jgi:hypothetical protein